MRLSNAISGLFKHFTPGVITVEAPVRVELSPPPQAPPEPPPAPDGFVLQEPAFALGPCAGNCGRVVARIRLYGDAFALTACPPCHGMARGVLVS